jgi:LemA protein
VSPGAIVVVSLVVIAVVALVAIVLYNGMVGARNKVDEAWSGIDVQLQRRHDLVPSLVESVEAYAAHERQTVQAVIDARAKALAASGPAAAGAAEGVLDQALGRLLAVAEAFPELRASEGFRQLQEELANTEDQIAAARRIYNGNVQAYNTRIQVFPASLVAQAGSFEPREYFELADPAARKPLELERSV